jgi:hypothetical protein
MKLLMLVWIGMLFSGVGYAQKRKTGAGNASNPVAAPSNSTAAPLAEPRPLIPLALTQAFSQELAEALSDTLHGYERLHDLCMTQDDVNRLVERYRESMPELTPEEVEVALLQLTYYAEKAQDEVFSHAAVGKFQFTGIEYEEKFGVKWAKVSLTSPRGYIIETVVAELPSGLKIMGLAPR